MLVLSGYGTGETPSLQMYDNLADKPVFSRYEKNCSYLCGYKDVIFGITEDEPTSAIYLYTEKGEALELADSRQIEGGLLCHINFLQKSSLLVGACYGTGNIFSVKVDMNNKRFCGEITYYTQGETQGRVHCVTPNVDETILYSANIMQDRIYRYHITQSGIEQVGYLQFSLGIGPRHILCINNSSYYVITEYSNEILLIQDNVVTQKYSTVADGFGGKSFGSTMCMTANKRFLYAANRGEDTIAVFLVDFDFSLTNIGRFACGEFPRHIALYDNDNYILSANQKGDNISIFKLDKESGMQISKIGEMPFCSPSFVMEWV